MDKLLERNNTNSQLINTPMADTKGSLNFCKIETFNTLGEETPKLGGEKPALVLTDRSDDQKTSKFFGKGTSVASIDIGVHKKMSCSSSLSDESQLQNPFSVISSSPVEKLKGESDSNRST